MSEENKPVEAEGPNLAASELPSSSPPGGLSPVASGATPRRPHLSKKIILLLLIILLAAGGAAAWRLMNDKSQLALDSSQSKQEIAELNVGVAEFSIGGLYPDIKTEYSGMTNSQIFEGLVRYEKVNKIAPLLATDWSNPDDKTWVFNLKPNVKFHNGHTLSAADVKYSIEYIQKNNPFLGEVFASTIKSVEVLNPTQVKITTDGPDAALLNRLTFLYIIDAKPIKGDEPSQAGSGPYMVKAGSQPDDNNLELIAYDQYHGERPLTRAVNFRVVKKIDDLLEQYNQGKFDIIGEIPTDQARAATSSREYIVHNPQINFFGINTVKKGPLQKLQVRRAINYAVDPVAIAEAYGQQARAQNQLISQEIPGFNPAIAPRQQDVDKAKVLLKEAGYPNGFTIKLAVSSSDKKWTDEMARQLKAVGITAKIDYRADFDKFIEHIFSGQADLFSVTYVSDIFDAWDIYSAAVAPENYSNPQFFKLLDRANGTVDPAARLKALQDIAVIVNKDLPVIPLSTKDSSWLANRDYALEQDTPTNLIAVYFAKVYLR